VKEARALLILGAVGTVYVATLYGIEWALARLAIWLVPRNATAALAVLGVAIAVWVAALAAAIFKLVQLWRPIEEPEGAEG
jgi:hypothetical protein